MKCVKNTITGKISRMPDVVANNQVAMGIGVFCGKIEFKKQERPDYVPGPGGDTSSKKWKRKIEAEEARKSRLGLN